MQGKPRCRLSSSAGPQAPAGARRQLEIGPFCPSHTRSLIAQCPVRRRPASSCRVVPLRRRLPPAARRHLRQGAVLRRLRCRRCRQSRPPGPPALSWQSPCGLECAVDQWQWWEAAANLLCAGPAGAGVSEGARVAPRVIWCQLGAVGCAGCPGMLHVGNAAAGAAEHAKALVRTSVQQRRGGPSWPRVRSRAAWLALLARWHALVHPAYPSSRCWGGGEGRLFFASLLVLAADEVASRMEDPWPSLPSHALCVSAQEDLQRWAAGWVAGWGGRRGGGAARVSRGR